MAEPRVRRVRVYYVVTIHDLVIPNIVISR